MDLGERGKDRNSSFPCFVINPGGFQVLFHGILNSQKFCVNMCSVFQVGYRLVQEIDTTLRFRLKLGYIPVYIAKDTEIYQKMAREEAGTVYFSTVFLGLWSPYMGLSSQ